MPALTQADPQGELFRRLLSLEADVRRLATNRREAPHNLRVFKSLAGPGQVIPAATFTPVSFDVESYSNPAGTWNTATSEWTPPSPGVYAVMATVEYAAGGPNSFHLGWSPLVGGGTPGNMISGRIDDGYVMALSTILTIYQGVTWKLSVWINAGGTLGYSNTALMVQRLSDYPHYT